jgi:hypothetical protein
MLSVSDAGAQLTRVVFQKIDTKNRAKRARSSVVSKWLYKPNGKRVRILSIDANSPTFGDDLGIVFRRNVAKAKREYKKKFGSPDRVVQKA